MPYPISLDLQPKGTQKQTQRLMMTPQMQQAIHMLQLPILELVQAIDFEVEQNPVLEYFSEEEGGQDGGEEDEILVKEAPEKEMEFDDRQLEILKHLDDDFRDLFAESGQFIPRRSVEEDKRKVFLDSMIQDSTTLAEHLLAQAREVLSRPIDLQIFEILLGYIEESGFLGTPIEEIALCFSLDPDEVRKVLKVMQGFDPIGVGAQNVRDALLIQLKGLKLEGSLPYLIVERHYDDLLHNRLPKIQKGLKVSLQEIHQAIQNEIAKLNLHPGSSFSKGEAPTLIPDVRIEQEGESLLIFVNEEQLKPLRLNRKYLRMLDDEALLKETKEFIRSKVLSAKWLVKNLHQRHETLERITSFLVERQRDFFMSPEGKLKPLAMKNVADELHLHESTIARAVANKYIETPRGIFLFRYFFSNAYVDSKGEDVSAKTVKELIRELISKEDKRKPFSDEVLSQSIKAKGIHCARRTVAKYRKELKIGNTQQRREY